MPPALRLSAISHSFAASPALTNVSLDVAPHEIVAVVGPSGCGKSTLLRIAASLMVPDAGEVHRTGARVGFVFQEPALLPWRRVRDNARVLVTDPNDELLVDELLHTSGLEPHCEKWPHELSGGMKMRLALVRTMASRPDVVLADEPFGALDQITRNHMHDELLRLHAERPFAMVVVTHAIDEAVYLADRVFTMSPAPGRIVAETEVKLPRPRRAGLRYGAEFAALCGRVATTLGGISA